MEGATLFYYEIHDQQFDGKNWVPFAPEKSFPTKVIPPPGRTLAGFDVVTFFAGNAPECSPLSYNRLAQEIATNAHCLLASFEEAYEKISAGALKVAEPGPYRIFAVYSVTP